MVFDADMTLLGTYENQERSAWNFHYGSTEHHPQMRFNAINGDFIRAQLREGTKYCCTDIADFMEPIFREFTEDYPFTNLFFRADSGYATLELYEQCEEYGAWYAIRLKSNKSLLALAEGLDDRLAEMTGDDMVSYVAVYGEFMYRADSWGKARRVCCKVEKPVRSIEHRFTFIVTNMGDTLEFVVGFYCRRGQMENFIKECKDDFDFSAVSSWSMAVNDNRLQIHVLVYIIFNIMCRLVFPHSMRKSRMETVHRNLVKVASRIVRHGRWVIYRLCSNCPFRDEFVQILHNIYQLNATYII